jgi:hypothetical protein
MTRPIRTGFWAAAASRRRRPLSDGSGDTLAERTSLPPAFRTENRITVISVALTLLLVGLFTALAWWFCQPPEIPIPFLAGNKGFDEVGVHMLKVENHSELHPRAGLIPYPPP